MLIGAQESWNLAGVSVAAGRGAGRSPDRTRTDGGGWWTMQAERIIMRTDSWARVWRAIRAIGDGGSTELIVHRHDLFTPWPTVNGQLVTAYDAVPHDDGTTHDDGTGYVDTVIVVSLASDVPLRAVEISLDIELCGTLQGGECFTVVHETMDARLYEIAQIQDQTSTTATVTIRPPWREESPAGTLLDFDRPRCVMRVPSPADMNETLDRVHLTPHSVKFEEAFPPFAA